MISLRPSRSSRTRPSLAPRFTSLPAWIATASAALTLTAALAHADPPHVTSSTAAPPMSAVRWLHRQVNLLDGRIMVLGGFGGASTAEIFDPKTSTWTPTAPMLFAADWPIAAVMCDGRVIVAGRPDLKQAEIYDPATDTWTDGGVMKYPHLYGTATLLTDCRVLFAGGFSSNTHAEVYDPAKTAFYSLGPMHNERFFHTATALPNGAALVAGGGVDAFGVWYTHATVDLLDPATGKWTKVKSMHSPRRAHTATLLPDGRILVAGGTNGGKADGTEGGTQLSSSEIYDLATDTWEKVATPLNTARTFHTATLLPGGAVLLFGGRDATGSVTSSVEGFFGGAFQPLEPLLVDRYLHGSTLLPDGRVLVTGGVHQATTEVYALADLGGACLSDIQCAGGHCVGGLCCDEACDTGCRRCDLPGRQGTCSRSCAGTTHALVCPDGTATCPNEACVEDACGEYLCSEVQGLCLEECQSVADCAPGYACGLDHLCVLPPDVSATDPDGCAFDPSAPGSGSPRQALWLLGALLAIARRRRR